MNVQNQLQQQLGFRLEEVVLLVVTHINVQSLPPTRTNIQNPPAAPPPMLTLIHRILVLKVTATQAMLVKLQE